MRLLSFISAAALAACLSSNAFAQAPAVQPIPASQEIAFPGTLKVFVDATDTQQRVLRVRQTVPVSKAGDFVLVMPRWLPGKHAPRPQTDKIANIRFSAGGKPLTWLRDPVEVTAFHVTVPEGVTEVTAEFDFLTPMTTTAASTMNIGTKAKAM